MTPEEIARYIKSGQEVYCIFGDKVFNVKLIYLDCPDYSGKRLAHTENFKIDINYIFQDKDFCITYLKSKLELEINDLERKIKNHNKEIDKYNRKIEEIKEKLLTL
jgi:hypothetical protein